jgi:hypothetical protein
MEVSSEMIRRNFYSKTDTELLDLANSDQTMTSEARFVLLQELRNRLESAKQAQETIQLRHGWYTVIAPKTGVRFPESCPRCFRFADVSLQFDSPEQRRFHIFWWRTSRATSNVPHCSECASQLRRSRAIYSWTCGLLGCMWVAVGVWLRVPRPVTYLGIFVISTPFVYLYDRTSNVKLSDSSESFIEYRFRSHEYAKAFAFLNEVQAENAETLEAELEDAISRVRG